MSYRTPSSDSLPLEPPKESGVQALIERLKKQGVEAGQQEAKSALDEAHAKARKILAEAQLEADKIKQQAREAAARETGMGQEALRLASRDVMVALKNQIASLFHEVFSRKVGAEFKREEFLQALLLNICQREMQNVPSDQSFKVLLSEDQTKSLAADSTLNSFVVSLCQESLGEGIEFGTTTEKYSGFKVRVEGEHIVVDLTDAAVVALLRQYLLPRFRTILEGYV